ncbi:helix-turn-helix transcriptional regulator [Candidatus Brocadia sp. AMX2]|uniref:Transcriptional regulators n=1 Tax=Candidatus Brocadia sinica JPN1 TaxID=1197129 RepID=A0ABQ0JXY8_9BACT|nr:MULTISPECIES: helix-turn-helix transcriptional regulator [Brocadia]MCK6469641.1 helix-turn-helix domain-containing protein [Candidatus Brocadia sinica]NOG40674.1 helix-turn-helix transcriptional regulator [Planctomycetota bacterium]MDL1937430.1 helix-turn-helix transcriptional regulator [Candidatus Brocadia sp. AMX2]NUO07053.1 helix-turn-helix transcriptional regulator [Candidatus Brocadia sinica]GAN33523.1 transcriptional regulators [Candidatus Brocadia sinica JPN1]
MEKKNVVGHNIRKFRLKAGITQEELALTSGLSQGYINQLESGKRNYTQKSLELIANALSMPIIEFFRDENEEIPVVSEKEVSYRKKGPYKKDFIQILNDLPEYIVEHYLTLLKLEKELQTKNKGNIYKNR